MSEPHIMSFNSFDELREYMGKAEDEANTRVTDVQRSIQPGDYVLRVAMTDEPLVIVAKTMTVDEIVEIEAGLGADEDELASTRESYTDSFERGYRYSDHWYSMVTPRGEDYGSAHISTLYPIDQGVYETIKNEIQAGRAPVPVVPKP